MSKKRPASGPDTGITSRPVKRARTHDAHKILTQSSEKALSKNGELDIGAFVKAREFEIRALQDTMAASKKGNASRAFQQVPRELRRRTASHNVKRVPKRLRARAIKEMKEDNTPTIEARKRDKSTRQHLRAQNAKKVPDLAKRIERQKERESRRLALAVKKSTANQLIVPKPTVLKYKKRQLNKFWLPTHVWHAKRARMTPALEPLWRFAIPLTPTEKSVRTTGRSSRLRGCVAWDMSYISTICIEGTEQSIVATLRSLGISERQIIGNNGSVWRSGSCSYTAWVCKRSDALKPLGRPIFIWQPPNDSDSERRLLIRIHPSAFPELWEELLDVGKVQEPPIKLQDLRSAIGSIDITGPAALESLIGILRPVESINTAETLSVWSRSAALQDSYSMPPGAMLNQLVDDPRLRQPHQTIEKDLLDSGEDTMKLSVEWSLATNDSSTSIFDSSCRQKAVRSLQTQSAINRRKAAALPGQKPESLPNDPQIPVLLLANNQSQKAQSPGGWTILMPWEFVLPTWHSLMHYPMSTGGNPRFGGLDEQQQLCFEDGRPWFPGDFPGTHAGWQWESDQQDRRKKEWDGKPKSRRVEWSSLDLGTGTKRELGKGWACDWQYLFKPQNDATETGESDGKDQMPPAGVCQITAPRLDAAETFLVNGLTTVSVALVNRGVPSPCARIYRLPTDNADLRAKWLEQLVRKKTDLATQEPLDDPTSTKAIPETPLPPGEIIESAPISDYPVVPSAADLVGFITSGNFNLAQGKGTGIGNIVWTRVVNEAKKNRGGTLHGLCIVRDAGQRVGRLARWETVT